jgi:hypothetical protein
MKLLFENWREFINEEEEIVDTLRIFDFDETIAHTRSQTRVKAPDGSEATLTNQQEFEGYMSAAAEKEGLSDFDPVEGLMAKGYEIDLSDFSEVKDPEEITVVTDELRHIPVNAKNYILTARRGNSLGPILNYLEEIGIDSNTVRPIATAGNSKGAVIANMIKQKIMADGQSNIKRVEYYEDSDKNIQDVMNHLCPDKLVELVVYKVIKSDKGYSLQHISC